MRFAMKIQKKIDEINSGKYSRSELQKIKDNANRMLEMGKTEVLSIIDALTNAVPSDRYIVFMGFCPAGSIENSQYEDWMGKGIRTYDWFDDAAQTQAFEQICVNDLVVLKKQNINAQKMTLHGWGRVKSISHNRAEGHVLAMDWSSQKEVIEVPLMGITKTVNVRALAHIEEKLPDSFFSWLGDDWVRKV
jgi:hypothetical protein